MPPRKPRDIDTELEALQDRAKALKARQKAQLGELVIAAGADTLSAEELAGLLLTGLDQDKTNPRAREGWRRRGESFFQRANGTIAPGNGTAPSRHSHASHLNADRTEPPRPGTTAE